jgi:signal transduction histidine kinase
MHIIPLANEHASFLLQIEELTDVVSLEARLRRSEALAQLGSMSAAVAHELRNPLAGISGAIQVIARSLPADAPYRPIMGKVDEEVRRLNALVTDLLAFARPGMARLEAVDLRQAAADAVGLVAADQPGVRFEVVGDGTAHADAHLVRQVLLNLLANAGQAVEGRGRVRIEVEDGRISVADDGPGVPPDRAEEIFQPFVTTKTRGTGLGLAISQRSARATHGDLRLAAESPLAGACFVLTLPVPQGDEDSGESHHPAV